MQHIQQQQRQSQQQKHQDSRHRHRTDYSKRHVRQPQQYNRTIGLVVGRNELRIIRKLETINCKYLTKRIKSATMHSPRTGLVQQKPPYHHRLSGNHCTARVRTPRVSSYGSHCKYINNTDYIDPIQTCSCRQITRRGSNSIYMNYLRRAQHMPLDVLELPAKQTTTINYYRLKESREWQP